MCVECAGFGIYLDYKKYVRSMCVECAGFQMYPLYFLNLATCMQCPVSQRPNQFLTKCVCVVCRSFSYPLLFFFINFCFVCGVCRSLGRPQHFYSSYVCGVCRFSDLPIIVLKQTCIEYLLPSSNKILLIFLSSEICVWSVQTLKHTYLKKYVLFSVWCVHVCRDTSVFLTSQLFVCGVCWILDIPRLKNIGSVYVCWVWRFSDISIEF